MPFFEERDSLRDRIDPRDHRCDVPDLDYSKVDNGIISCKVCARTWRSNPPRGWWPNPCPKCGIAPERCQHYGQRGRRK